MQNLLFEFWAGFARTNSGAFQLWSLDVFHFLSNFYKQAQLARKENECMQLIEERNTLDSEKMGYMRQISRLQTEKVCVQDGNEDGDTLTNVIISITELRMFDKLYQLSVFQLYWVIDGNSIPQYSRMRTMFVFRWIVLRYCHCCCKIKTSDSHRSTCGCGIKFVFRLGD